MPDGSLPAELTAEMLATGTGARLAVLRRSPLVHRSEKNLMPWAQQRVKSLYERLVVPLSPPLDNTYKAVEVKVKSNEPTGEMVVMNRKGKLIFIFDMTLALTWEGILADGVRKEKSDKAKGEIKITQIENDEPTPTLKVKCDQSGPEYSAVVSQLQAARSQLLAPLEVRHRFSAPRCFS